MLILRFLATGATMVFRKTVLVTTVFLMENLGSLRRELRQWNQQLQNKRLFCQVSLRLQRQQQRQNQLVSSEKFHFKY